MTQFNCADVENIKSNLISVPEEGTYHTERMGAPVGFHIDRSDATVELTINGMWFTAPDIKELRKFLKILEQEIK